MSAGRRLGMLLLSYGAVLVLAVDSGWTWLDAPLAMVMVFVLPGYAVVSLLDPTRRFGRWERTAIALGVSISLVVLVGLGTSFVGLQITRSSWLLTLGGFVVVANTLALLVALGVTREDAGAAASKRSEADARRWAWPAVAVVLAWSLTLGAIVWATPEADPPGSGDVVQLWALPKGDDTGRVEVGVANLVSDTTRYRLTVTQDDEVLSDGVIDIAEGDSAIFVVEASSGATSASQVEAVLSSVVFTSGPLRRVYVTPSRNGGAAVEREEEAERP